jgi:hypothetical protein
VSRKRDRDERPAMESVSQGIMRACLAAMRSECEIERAGELEFRELMAKCALRKTKIMKKLRLSTPIGDDEVKRELAAPLEFGGGDFTINGICFGGEGGEKKVKTEKPVAISSIKEEVPSTTAAAASAARVEFGRRLALNEDMFSKYVKNKQNKPGKKKPKTAAQKAAAAKKKPQTAAQKKKARDERARKAAANEGKDADDDTALKIEEDGETEDEEEVDGYLVGCEAMCEWKEGSSQYLDTVPSLAQEFRGHKILFRNNPQKGTEVFCQLHEVTKVYVPVKIGTDADNQLEVQFNVEIRQLGVTGRKRAALMDVYLDVLKYDSQLSSVGTWVEVIGVQKE